MLDDDVPGHLDAGAPRPDVAFDLDAPIATDDTPPLLDVEPDATTDAHDDETGPTDAAATADSPPPVDGGPFDGGPFDAALAPPAPLPPPPDAGPIDPAPPLGSYVGRPRMVDVVLDWERHRVLSSLGLSGSIDVVDLSTGTVSALDTGHRAERMHFDPLRDEIAVVLADGVHGNPSGIPGFLGILDARSLVIRTLALPFDPYAVVVDGSGHAYVTRGTSGFEPLASVDLETGAFSDTRGEVLYLAAGLALHPSRDRVYVGFSDVVRFDLGPPVAYAYSCSDCRAASTLRADPRGRTLHLSTGDVLATTNAYASDLTLTGTLGTRWLDAGFQHDGARLFIVTATGAVDVYDVASLTRLGTLPVPRPTSRILVGFDYLVLVSVTTGTSAATHFDVLALPGL